MDIREILEAFGTGKIDVSEAERRLRTDYIEAIGSDVLLDPGRQIRKGVPEVVFARGKTPETVAEILRSSEERILVSGAGPEHFEAVRNLKNIQTMEDCGCIVYGGFPEEKYGPVAFVTAGTSDIPVAREAVLMARMMGCACLEYYDVGVAGLHRILKPMKEIIEKDAAAIVVAAGMEGALPTIVSSLSPVPVIGVPVSSGYGFGGGGTGALIGMLQSCSPGLSVVNIDNGIGAGAAAGLIAAGRSR
ncbi:MAG: nickel pincer cofactor biosynthesis protein LarB [Candidatus Methanomethylophilaceae archaeon]|jgi:NCAIR mutase (PurE)-related protein